MYSKPWYGKIIINKNLNLNLGQNSTTVFFFSVTPINKEIIYLLQESGTWIHCTMNFPTVWSVMLLSCFHIVLCRTRNSSITKRTRIASFEANRSRKWQIVQGWITTDCWKKRQCRVHNLKYASFIRSSTVTDVF